IFKNPTIRELAEYIRSTTKKKYSGIPTAPQKNYYPLSDAQKRMFILSNMDTQSTVYNVSSVMELEGPLEMDTLENAFLQLIQRHDSFRTSFRLEEGEPVQVIHDTGAIPFNIHYLDLSQRDVGIEEPAEGEPGEAVIEAVNEFIRPFDLTSAPLLRVKVIKCGPGKHHMAVDMHHIVSDGVSMEIIAADLLKAYRGEELPPLPLQYKDYSHWQN
ncbi:MAG: hypothetical protein GY765_10110, partial [bacterium]|nr:hypothetical protein [bacterium]